MEFSFDPDLPANFPFTVRAVETSAQTVCRPTYQIARLDLVQNGTDREVATRREDSHATLQHVRSWDIMTDVLAQSNTLRPDLLFRYPEPIGNAGPDFDNFANDVIGSRWPSAVDTLSTDSRYLAAIFS